MTKKFRSWIDCHGDLESAIPLDDLLADISLYWFSDSLTESLRLYKENPLRPPVFEEGERIKRSLGVSLFPREIAMSPRYWAERVFDMQRWIEMPAGGHFAVLEKPNLLAVELRAFFRPFRLT